MIMQKMTSINQSIKGVKRGVCISPCNANSTYLHTYPKADPGVHAVAYGHVPEYRQHTHSLVGNMHQETPYRYEVTRGMFKIVGMSHLSSPSPHLANKDVVDAVALVDGTHRRISQNLPH